MRTEVKKSNISAYIQLEGSILVKFVLRKQVSESNQKIMLIPSVIDTFANACSFFLENKIILQFF